MMNGTIDQQSGSVDAGKSEDGKQLEEPTGMR